MRAVIQRVKYANVKVDEKIVGEINAGLLILLGIQNDDTLDDADFLVKRLEKMRIFEDENEKMNLSIKEIDGNALVVSQFTLFGSMKKGSRPSFNRAAPPALAIPLYEAFIQKLSAAINKPISTGKFGAMMQVELVNDGPVTILLDSKLPEL